MINAVSQVFMRCRTTDEPELLHQPDPALFCPICSRILEIPIRTNCGHTSCAECLRWHMTTSPDCPCAVRQSTVVPHSPIDSPRKSSAPWNAFAPSATKAAPGLALERGLPRTQKSAAHLGYGTHGSTTASTARCTSQSRCKNKRQSRCRCQCNSQSRSQSMNWDQT